MLPKSHAILGAIFSSILIHFFHFSLIAGGIIFLSSVLIDVDHYLYYVYKKKDWSLKRAYGWFIKMKNILAKIDKEKRKNYFSGFSILHGIEILAVLLFLGFFLSTYFYYILIGFSFHLFLDIIYGRLFIGRIERLSLVYDFIKYSQLKFIEDVR